jgi:hypothetical protein
MRESETARNADTLFHVLRVMSLHLDGAGQLKRRSRRPDHTRHAVCGMDRLGEAWALGLVLGVWGLSRASDADHAYALPVSAFTLRWTRPQCTDRFE